MSQSLFQRIVATGARVANHGSDLYVEAYHPGVREILADSSVSFSYFTCQISGLTMIDVPFMFEPFWESKRVSR
jgi:hypothetical protein